MAKLPSEKKEKVVYPSQFGSHTTMINLEATEALKNPEMVVCIDQFGEYQTSRNNLDNGLADVNRYSNRKIEIEIKKEEN